MSFDVDNFIFELEEALRNNQMFLFVCKCEVTYNGRAESFLPLGERVIIIKNDNTLLVHQPTGSMPVNHMRLGGKHWVQKSGSSLVLLSEHEKHKEELSIIISEIKFFRREFLEDNRKIITKGTEKDMAEMLYRNPEMIEEDLKPLSQEEHTKYGFIDLFGYDKDNNLVVIECKRQKADLQAVTQLRRYVEKIKESKGLSHVRGILVSPSISDNAKRMLQEWGYKWVLVEPPRFKTIRNKNQTELHHF